MRKKFILLSIAILIIALPVLLAQDSTTIITEKEVSSILNMLASDAMQGRASGSPELLKAGLFIGNKYKTAGLMPLSGMPGYYLPFKPGGISTGILTDSLRWNGKFVKPEHFFYFAEYPGVYKDRSSNDFDIVKIDSFFTEDIMFKFWGDTTPVLLWTDRLQPDSENVFPERLKIPATGLRREILLVYSKEPPENLFLTANKNYHSRLDYNVIGMLPGRSKPSEVILFSAHYDHVGIYPGSGKDTVFNGANDNASGVTALIALAEYFANKNDNERTIMFCAFSGEEYGLMGSRGFVNYINPEKIIAAINIEMIGVPQYGRNVVFITGSNYSDLPAMLKKGLLTKKVRAIREPNELKALFKRSDNYPFALKAVPAHTIMSSDDDDACYHRICDEIKRINISHLTNIIQAIAIASESLINGKQTPVRIDVSSIK